jgi:transposase
MLFKRGDQFRKIDAGCHEIKFKDPYATIPAGTSARLKRLIAIYGNRKNPAGRLVRRLELEMEYLWLFLQEAGVDPTNNHAERILRFGVLRRKRSLGMSSEHGDRWVERVLTLRQTCKSQRRRSFPVLVDALAAAFQPQSPKLAWIQNLATP